MEDEASNVREFCEGVEDGGVVLKQLSLESQDVRVANKTLGLTENRTRETENPRPQRWTRTTHNDHSRVRIRNTL